MRICPQCRTRTTSAICLHDGFQTVDSAFYREDAAKALVGTVFQGRYQIDELLAQGGMGDVYRATQLAVNRQVAIKVLHPQPGRDLRVVARFQQEARAIAALSHPNIIGLIDFGQSEEHHSYLVMEFAEGETLWNTLRAEAPLDPERARHIALQLCEALAAAHQAEIVHRDLSPANVVLTRQGRLTDVVKVLDFGIARITGKNAPKVNLTGSGLTLGSPPYMSPEQAMAEPAGPAADLYAVGVTLYEMLTGRTPFVCESPVDYLRAHVHQEPPALRAGGLPLEGPLVDLTLQLLAKAPGARPASAEDAAAVLESCAGRAAWRVEPPASVAPVIAPPEVVPDDTGQVLVPGVQTVETLEVDDVSEPPPEADASDAFLLDVPFGAEQTGARWGLVVALAAAVLLSVGLWWQARTPESPPMALDAAALVEARPETPIAAAAPAARPGTAALATTRTRPELPVAAPSQPTGQVVVAPPVDRPEVEAGDELVEELVAVTATSRRSARRARARARAVPPAEPTEPTPVAAPEAPEAPDLATFEDEILEAESALADRREATEQARGAQAGRNELLVAFRDGAAAPIPVRIGPTEPVVPIKLSASAVSKTLRARRRALQSCVKQLPYKPSSPLEVTAVLRIRGDGSVASSAIKRGQGTNGPARTCILHVLDRTRFPVFRSPDMTVTYPVILR